MSVTVTPPAARSPLWQNINQAATEGLFKLPVCSSCRQVQYPPQEFCRGCLAGDLCWEEVSPLGAVLSWTRLQASNHPYFMDRLPVFTGLVKLDCGPVMVVYLAESCLQTGTKVQVTGTPDASGQVVFMAAQPEAEFNDG
ncbi:MAG: OB-fold domain-containing protein [Gammaproteobacteria bacterium]|nr:OB-fold domain-containing protein [Gammaproteobacteria bacterium]MCY4338527.1 OB-fold domain-containing protein [Gammaproteobacteria bacterium]